MDTNSAISTRVRGKTIRLAWTEGPTKGKTHEHIFHDDGTVEWHAVGEEQKHKAPQKSEAAPERAKYAGVDIDKESCMVSYLSKSGFTLTVALNFSDASTVGVASNDKTWVPVRGHFEVVH